MAIPVKLEVFEGPLDLLLHLIEKNKIDIYDIPIVDITEQYLTYIKQMEQQDMNVMSEFLVMAATLVDIKCKMLLPPEIDEEGEEIDPRAELVEKLIEYKMYKYMALELKDRELDAANVFYRSRKLPKEVTDFIPPVDYEKLVEDVNLTKLHELFKTIIRRQEDRIDPIRSRYGNIEKEEIDMDAKTQYVRVFAQTHKSFSFTKLLESQKSRAELIVTFLIILEMMHDGDIEISQEELFDDIMITSKIAG